MKMYNLEKFKGVFVALNAIYDDKDNVNISAMKELVKIYKTKGVSGVYVCGSTGEGFLLSVEERKQVAAAVKEAAGDDFTVIVHVGCASTKESIELENTPNQSVQTLRRLFRAFIIICRRKALKCTGTVL